MALGRFRVGVIGLGVGEQHLAAFVNERDCEVAAICDLSSDVLGRVAKQYRGVAATQRPDEILSNPDIDIVSIASYDDCHFEQVMMALEGGKHVFVEKPLCMTLDELRAIKRQWAGAGGRLKLASNLVLRAAPAYRWLREQVAGGVMGEVYAFDGDYLYGRLDKITRGWRKNVEGYSVMMGGGIHLIDLMLWITAQRPSNVTATGSRICTRGSEFHQDDFLSALLEFPSGLVARITANFGCVHRHQHVVRLFGTEGTFIHDDAGPRWHRSRDPELPPDAVSLSPLPASKGALIADFVGTVRGAVDADAETQSHFDAISIALACNEAAQIGRSVEVQYV